ncbi:FAD-dependent oxidoreductase [Neogemmobacter tilapiae]|uniref:Glutamate synthase n=1 Tax=Neogemmobacter tilapiae TaxID=875041 RepID=A0A918TPC4_9RHOB|nr:NAD(P)/FAD-dependent oxidoreductase [Gemmobacter tilapiae]GHC53883.1 glutamate synthase [Gemmobacter tilapiae]
MGRVIGGLGSEGKAMKMAIVGAGVGGLALAGLLAGRDVTLVERFAAARPLGSGLVVQPVGLAVLDRLGAGDAARSLGAVVRRMEGRTVGGRVVLDVAYRRGAAGLAMHRASLFQVLWDRVGAAGVPVVTGCEVVGSVVDNGRWLLLGNGERLGPFDLVVDASGAGSKLSPLKARALGYGAVWGHVVWPEGAELPEDELRQCYRGASRMAGIMPAGCLPDDPRPRAAVFWSMNLAELGAWAGRDLEGWKAEVREHWPAMGPFLEGITAVGQMTAARYSHGNLWRPYEPALAFIGDAAHRASPQLGQGANMALLDAYALAIALRGDDPLRQYARLRRWHVRAYQALSWAFTPQYQSDSRILPPIRDHLLAPISRALGVRGILSNLVSGEILPPLASTAFP